ncbi:MAG: pantoate--beta-alanine ligase [Blastocatellia bacterium]|nr:pantoate--beta-alanine ligase [Blastocatellia bacterium]MCS7157381.1 pantoate--beta-alanine ligase [Blastocatellia bacterium]MCX7753247.1 pantoate--beta-alanine ligase [Blastocatellia bacterium]MDW8168286.1 pantoate--beta-alanine ligase [Acidobacteriota bacterium]MDW8255421.1 pantoate--beta-alanine ligase [Acidobacteriota bacterium]
MEVIKSAARMQAVARKYRAEGRTIGLIPTAGHLHEGHLSLIRRAHELAEILVVAISPPPLVGERPEGERRGGREKPARYLSDEVEVLSPLGVHYVFAPTKEELFAEGACTEVVVRGLSERLYGATHPEHFVRLTTYLMVLFNVIHPHFVIFGWKDAQQVVIARRMVRDLHVDVEVVTCPIVRDADGLAIAPENEWLTERERQAARVIPQALEKAQVLVAAGERHTANILKVMREMIEAHPAIRIEYLSIVDGETLEPIPLLEDRPALVMVAAVVGKVRLSDNVLLNA